MNDRGAGARVLLVDDHQDVREMYAEYLHDCGYEVLQAASGLEAIERAVAGSPQLVVLDLSLPVLGGWEVTRRLKADSRTAQVFVVVLTGDSSAHLSEDARTSGCDGFVLKPCLPEALLKEIERLLPRAPTRRHLEDPAPDT